MQTDSFCLLIWALRALLSITLCDFLKSAGAFYVFRIDGLSGFAAVYCTEATAVTVSSAAKSLPDILFSFLPGGGLNFRRSHQRTNPV